MSAEPQQNAPVSFGRFQVTGVIGQGGMGQVYEAWDPELRRTVAIKTVRSDSSDPAHVERLRREAQACATLQHPNIVTVFDAGSVGDVVFVVMEFLRGEHLGRVLRQADVPIETRLSYLDQILRALQYAHDSGVIHRDIKPSNVCVLPDGTVKLLDFGLARVVRSETITESQVVMGTPHYAAPEQLRGERVDARADIYSTGVLAYEMFARRRPFEADTLASLVAQVLTTDPPLFENECTRLMPALCEVIFRAMAKSAADRFRSASEMRTAVAAAASGRSAPTASASRGSQDVTVTAPAIRATSAEAPTELINKGPSAEEPSRHVRRKRALALAIATLVLGIAATLGFNAFGRRTAPQAATSPPAPERTSAPAPPTTPPPPAQETPSVEAAARPAAVQPPPEPQPPAPPEKSSGTAGGVAAARTLPTGGTQTAAVPEARLTAKQMFLAANDASRAVAAPSAGLRIRVVTERAGGEEVAVDPDTTFKQGDKVRFVFDSNVDGYLYVVAEGSSGKWSVLFPHPDINGGVNRVRAFEPARVPSAAWFEFDATPGTERLFVLFSKEPLRELPGFSSPVTQMATVDPSVVDRVRGQINSRDLVLQKDRAPGGGAGKTSANPATYVVNRDELGKAVTTTVELVHK